MKKIFFILLFFLTFYINSALAYDDKTVHPNLTVRALIDSKIIDYFKNNFGVEFEANKSMILEQLRELDINKLLKVIKADPLLNQIRQGSIDEDAEMLEINCKEHFYDPRDGRGLMGVFNNSLARAEGILSDAHIAFLDYLTFPEKNFREERFKHLLHSLGKVMHLIEDKAVPAHVRDDPHVPHWPFSDYEPYENGTADKYQNLIYTGYEPVLVEDFDSLSKFWDWNKGLAEFVFNDNSKGLAEYTCHNFLSKDTMYIDYYNKWSKS